MRTLPARFAKPDAGVRECKHTLALMQRRPAVSTRIAPPLYIPPPKYRSAPCDTAARPFSHHTPLVWCTALTRWGNFCVTTNFLYLWFTIKNSVEMTPALRAQPLGASTFGDDNIATWISLGDYITSAYSKMASKLKTRSWEFPKFPPHLWNLHSTRPIMRKGNVEHWCQFKQYWESLDPKVKQKSMLVLQRVSCDCEIQVLNRWLFPSYSVISHSCSYFTAIK